MKGQVECMVAIVIEIRAGRDDPVDEACLDEGDDAGSPQAGGRERPAPPGADDVGPRRLPLGPVAGEVQQQRRGGLAGELGTDPGEDGFARGRSDRRQRRSAVMAVPPAARREQLPQLADQRVPAGRGVVPLSRKVNKFVRSMNRIISKGCGLTGTTSAVTWKGPDIRGPLPDKWIYDKALDWLVDNMVGKQSRG